MVDHDPLAEFLGDAPDDLVCLICMHVVGSNGPATVTVSCGHLFCQRCIQQWLSKSGGPATCPVDRRAITHDDLRPDVRSQRRADALEVRCGSVRRPPPTTEELANGRPQEPCSWKGPWCELMRHEQSCPHTAPRALCPLRPLGCENISGSFGIACDEAGVSAKASEHFRECTAEHFQLIATSITAQQAHIKALQNKLDAVSRTVTQLHQEVDAAQDRVKAFEQREADALSAPLLGDLRTVFDELAVLKSGTSMERCAPSPVARESAPSATAAEEQFAFRDLAPDAAPSFVRRVTQQLFHTAAKAEPPTTAALSVPGWSMIVAGPRPWHASDGPATFQMAVVDLRAPEDRHPEEDALSGAMIGVTTNRGAVLHHGRRGHFGFVPGSCGLQGSGFAWSSDGASTPALISTGGERLTFVAGDTVTVRVATDAARETFTTISFEVAGRQSIPLPSPSLGRGPIFPAGALLVMHVGLALV